MKQKLILAAAVLAVALAAAFALHRPQAGTQPTPEPTRQADASDAANDLVEPAPTQQPAATAEPRPTATAAPQQTDTPKPAQTPATKKPPVLNAAGQRGARRKW